MTIDYKLLAEQFESILDHLPGLVFYKDRDNRFIHVNQYIADAYGKSKKELEGVSLYDLTNQKDAEKYHQDDLAVINSGVPKLHIEEPWRTKDGLRWVSTSKIPFVDHQGSIIGVIGISMDITERKRADHRIKELIHKLTRDKDFAEKNSLTDSLTRIPNRRHFDETLAREYFRIKRCQGQLSAILIDIDHFKKFNDCYGHLAGDECLFRVASAIKNSVLRPSDFVARYGGEEFVVILPETGESGAKVVARRLLKTVENLKIQHEDSDNADHVTVSLGIATVFPEQALTPESLVQLADEALYQAKAKGRNQFQVAVYKAEALAENLFTNLEWHETNTCGNQVIDSQHKELYTLSNRLVYFIGKGKPKNECAALLNQLVLQSKQHFKDEEDILASIHYPFITEHRKLHERLLKGITDLLKKFNDGNLEIDELVKYIAFDVVLEHLIVEDKKFFHYLTPDSHTLSTADGPYAGLHSA